MDNLFDFEKLQNWILPTVAFLISIVVLSLIWKSIHHRLTKWADKTTSTIDDQIVLMLKVPARILIFLFSIQIAFHLSPVADQSQILKTITKLAVIGLVIWLTGRVGSLALETKLMKSDLDATTRGFFSKILWIITGSIGFLVVLDSLGISITPILASLGVGSLAVGLALQETLSNFFSGIYIILDKPFRVGDLVKVDGDVEGHVLKIGWRSTHFRLLNNNLVVLPNAKVGSSQIVNYDMDDSQVIVNIEVGVSYSSNLEHVEQITKNVALEVASKLKIVDHRFEPIVRFNALADSSINLRLIVRINSWIDQSEVRHEMIKAIHKKYQEEKIEIPFPQTVVHLQKT